MGKPPSSAAPNKNLKALSGIRQISKREGGTEFDIEVEAVAGQVRMNIKAKDAAGFPGVILNLDPQTALTLGVSLVAKSDEANGY